MNPSHAHIPDPRLWETEGKGTFNEANGEQCGVTRLRIVREIPTPQISPEDRIRFAILCALEVCTAPIFVSWANGWLNAADRSSAASWEAAHACWTVSDTPPPERPPEDRTGTGPA